MVTKTANEKKLVPFLVPDGATRKAFSADAWLELERRGAPIVDEVRFGMTPVKFIRLVAEKRPVEFNLGVGTATGYAFDFSGHPLRVQASRAWRAEHCWLRLEYYGRPRVRAAPAVPIPVERVPHVLRAWGVTEVGWGAEGDSNLAGMYPWPIDGAIDRWLPIPCVYAFYTPVSRRRWTTKIGYTVALKSRFSSVQASIPSTLGLMAAFRGGRRTEQAVHEALSASRVRGEWFRLRKDPPPKRLIRACDRELARLYQLWGLT